LGSMHEGERAVFAGNYSLNAIEAAPPGFALVSATHSRLGDIGPSGTNTAPFNTDFAIGDSLHLVYQPASGDTATNENCFFVIQRLGAPGTFARHQPLPYAPPALPVTFALHQNQPNPFMARTTIHFDPPVGEIVKIEAFDASGRHVETIANRF